MHVHARMNMCEHVHSWWLQHITSRHHAEIRAAWPVRSVVDVQGSVNRAEAPPEDFLEKLVGMHCMRGSQEDLSEPAPTACTVTTDTNHRSVTHRFTHRHADDGIENENWSALFGPNVRYSSAWHRSIHTGSHAGRPEGGNGPAHGDWDRDTFAFSIPW